MNLLQDLNKCNYEEFVALNVDLLDIPTVIDSEDKPMPDSTKTGDLTIKNKKLFTLFKI